MHCDLILRRFKGLHAFFVQGAFRARGDCGGDGEYPATEPFLVLVFPRNPRSVELQAMRSAFREDHPIRDIQFLPVPQNAVQRLAVVVNQVVAVIFGNMNVEEIEIWQHAGRRNAHFVLHDQAFGEFRHLLRDAFAQGFQGHHGFPPEYSVRFGGLITRCSGATYTPQWLHMHDLPPKTGPYLSWRSSPFAHHFHRRANYEPMTLACQVSTPCPLNTFPNR